MITPEITIKNNPPGIFSEAVKLFTIFSRSRGNAIEVPVQIVSNIDLSTIKIVRDATANNSSKNFPVPIGKRWEINYVQAWIACSATVGNRELIGIVWDPTTSNVLYAGKGTAAIAAAQTGQIIYAPGKTDSTTVSDLPSNIGVMADIQVNQSMPVLSLVYGQAFKVYDVNAVDAAADDLTVIFQVREYDA